MDNEIISFTTRAKRDGEEEGIDYLFITQEEFDALMKEGRIAEHTTYYGSASYGITMDELEGKLAKGDAFVVVDVVGKKQLEELYPNTTSVFFRINEMTAIKRMQRRGDSAENIAKRLKTYGEEIDNYYLYDYIVENEGNHADTIESVRLIIEKEGTK
jgi:guanylate kinase